jgi:hypothetical protein
LLLIAGFDYITDVELRAGLFYAVPVVLVAWSVLDRHFQHRCRRVLPARPANAEPALKSADRLMY